MYNWTITIKNMSELITALDIGSNKIRMIVAQRIEDGPPSDFPYQIIGASEVPSQGIRRGVIINIEDTVSSVSQCLENVERMTGQQVESVWVGIAGTHISSQESKGVIAVSKPSGEINDDDIERAIEAARTVVTPLNYEILHVIPRSFSVDGQGGIKDPTGMTGIRLEVDTQIIQGLTSYIKNLTKSIYRTGLDIEDIVLSILGTGESVLSKRQKELGVLLVDIGSATTSVIVYEEGDVLYTSILPIGSDHITADIAIGLRQSPEIAESVKLEYGHCLPTEIDDNSEIDLGIISEEKGTISHNYVAQIIQARVEEIFEKIDQELIKIGRSGMLPAGVVLVGGGAKIPGIIEIAKDKLRLPASLGYPKNLHTAITRVDDISYATALGLLMWGNQMMVQKNSKPGGILSGLKSVGGVSKKVTGWLKSLKT